jgi:DNA-binding beta-propeller fold protein YncE
MRFNRRLEQFSTILSRFSFAACLVVLPCALLYAPLGSPAHEPPASLVNSFSNADAISVELRPVDTVASRRLPAAIALDAAGNWLMVANEATGTLSMLSVTAPHRTIEYQVGSSITDLAVLGTSEFVATVDPLDHQLRILRLNEDALTQVAAVTTANSPVQLAIAADGERIAVASLWSRRVSLWRWSAETLSLQPLWTVDLDIAPRQLQFLPNDERLLVADAFGGHLLGLNTSDGSLIRDREIPAHKIRGLAITPDGKRLVMAHQMLNGLAHAIRNDVHWGLMMSNDLRWLDLEVLLSPDENFYRDSHMHPLGQPGAGMADPAGVAISSQGDVAVAIQGVDQVLVGKESDFSLDAITVGPGPVDVAFSADGVHLFVAHRWDDSISIVDVAQRDPVIRIPLGNIPDESMVETGRRLFHQGRLAHDNWMSCASCHVDGHSNGHLNDNFSDGSFGAPKRVLSLLGVAGTEPLAWNGAKASIEEQVRASIEATMQSPVPPTAEEVAAISEFVRSLSIPPSLHAARGTLDQTLIDAGNEVFQRAGCVECHAAKRQF